MPKQTFRNKLQFWNNADQGNNKDRRVAFQTNDRDRRQNFKSNKHDRRDQPHKDWRNAIRSHLEDEDVDMGIMGDTSRSFKLNRKGRGGGRGRQGSPPPQKPRRKLLEGPSSWYKVSLPHGDKFDKTFLSKALLDKMAPIQFWPIMWQVFGSTITFYVDDFKAAQKLHELDRQIQLPNGFKLFIRVHAGTPNVDMTVALKEKMKLVMAKRYNGATKALDLTKFHADPDLQDSFCALFKPIVFLAAVDIIAENIPELEALNLFENKIQLLNFLKTIDKKIPNLKILHLGNNKIRDIAQLDILQGLPIIDLLLDGNPLCDKFKDKPAYIRYDGFVT